MIDDIRKANESVTASSRNIALLRQHFPGCFTKDGTFDIEKFRELISDDATVDYQGHALRYLGQQYARLLVNEDTTTVMVPNEVHNSKPENANSQNIFISGDNLDALKHLSHSYAGKVKLIYIDPPYNTGSDDFVYQDKFNFTAEELAEKLSISEEHAGRILKMTRGKSSSHSAWLTFMEPRLRLARELLSEDGVIFISIDDNEQANLRLLCDDIFGGENFFVQLVWQSRTSVQNDTDLSVQHEYLIGYAKKRRYEHRRLKEANKSLWYDLPSFAAYPLPVDESRYSNPDDDPRGPWKLDPFDAPNIRENLIYPITNPNTGETMWPPEGRHWRTEEPNYQKLLADGRILFGKTGKGRPQLKVFYEEKKDFGEVRTSWWDGEGYDTVTAGTRELQAIFSGQSPFSHPKPTKLICELIQMCTRENDIVLDFFSGSATTAQAVFNQNLNDGGSRRFIMVQIQEPVKPNGAAEKAGYKTIDEIGIDRIVRVANQLREEHPGKKLDLGFKQFVLKEPSIQTLDKLERFDPEAGIGFADETILQEFGVPTVLTTWMVRDGYGLAAKPKPIDFDGYTGYHIGQHLYLVAPNLTEAAITAIVDRLASDPEIQVRNVVLFGYSFTWTQLDAIKTNLRQLKDSERNLSLNTYTRY